MAGYQWVGRETPNPDGTFGVDYYFQGMPITREEYESGTGESPGALEQWHNAQMQTNYQTPVNYSTGGTGGGGWQPISFEGKTYSDENSYRNAVITAANREWDLTNKALDSALSRGMLDFDKYNNLITQNRDSLKKQLNKNLNLNATYFTNISPNAIQSGQFEAQREIEENERKGQENLNQEQASVDRSRTAFSEDIEAKRHANELNKLSNIDAVNNRITGLNSVSGEGNFGYQPQFANVGQQQVSGGATVAALNAGAFANRPVANTGGGGSWGNDDYGFLTNFGKSPV